VRAGARAGCADRKSGRTALHWAARHGHLETVRWLLERAALPADGATKDGTTPLQLAAWGGHARACALLEAAGADVHATNRWACSAAHFAALAGRQGVCEWLCARGASLGVRNAQGHDALHKAAYGGHRELCRWLCDAPARLAPARVDARGQTAADLARKAGFVELAAELAALAAAADAPPLNEQ
jgi:ankyrin repeat protein